MNSVEDKNLFESGISIALEEWDALQAAIDHGMGGEFTDEKVNWMISVIKKYFIDTRNSFDFDDAVKYVEEIMDNEFDTLIEDESTEILIKKLMKFFSLSNEEKFDELRTLLKEKVNKLNSTKEDRKKRRQETRLKEDLEEFDLNSCDEEENSSNEDNNQDNDEKKDNRAKTDQDGWTMF